jgi:tetratricopeptide (TPR) repeat protein
MTVSSLAHASAGADKPPLDALVETPDLSMSIQSASPDELRLLALLTLGRLHLDREELGQARVTLTQALAYLETEPSNMAILYSYMAYVSQAERPARLDQAIQYYSEAIDMATDAPIAYLNRGVAYIRQNRPQQWQQDFERVLALRPGHVAAHQALCWAYALDMRPELALPHCDAAVAQDSSEGSREGRGVVYAQLGRFSEAIADLQSTLDWLEQRPQSLRARYGPVRAKWVEELKAGRNPFDQAALEELRQE